ncbi:TPA: S24 family peptidase [Streptococcus suis]
MFAPQKLKVKREQLGISQTEVALKLSVSRITISKWEAGITKPNQKNLSALAKIFQVAETYFESEYQIVENYLRLNDENKLAAENYVENLLTQQEIAERVLPLYSYHVLSEVKLSAGPGQGVYDDYATETVYADKEYSGYDVAAWVRGTSMEPQYLDGEVALIRETGFDYDGAVYALVWEGQTYIKKLYREEEGLRMVSINKRGNPDRFISYDDDFHVVGKVVGHFMPIEGV